MTADDIADMARVAFINLDRPDAPPFMKAEAPGWVLTLTRIDRGIGEGGSHE